MIACPRCPQTGLKHTLISESLPAHTCPSCAGILISLVAYRLWRETYKATKEPGFRPTEIAPADDPEGAITCGKCRALMTKYRISADVPNRIDFCASCEDIWLDEGEWALVESLAGSEHLSTIITQPWQRRIRMESEAHMEDERLRAVFGNDYQKVSDFREWLNSHPARDEVFAYLRKSSR